MLFLFSGSYFVFFLPRSDVINEVDWDSLFFSQGLFVFPFARLYSFSFFIF